MRPWMPAFAGAVIAATHAHAQTKSQVPVCEWGECEQRCVRPCPTGSVCGVDGVCIYVSEPEEAPTPETAPDPIAIQLALNRRYAARALMRVTLGAGWGVAKLEHDVPVMSFVGDLGIRKQLAPAFGISSRIALTVGMFQSQGKDQPFDSTYLDVWGNLDPYFGPFGRFYVGPALVFGHRHFNASNPSDGPQSLVGLDRTRFEGGARIGVLFGNREQFDMWFQGTSSFTTATTFQYLMGLSFEFMDED